MLIVVGIVAAFMGRFFGKKNPLNDNLTMPQSEKSNRLKARVSRMTQGILV